MPNIILLQEIGSTNDLLKRNAATMESGTLIRAYKQTAGRGQKGNSWEAEAGKNLTFSMLFKNPCIDVKHQFAISEAVSLAIIDVLDNYAPGFSIKWPNDIYHNDRKIAGILIEHSLGNEGIDYTIAGVGLNINQQVFTSSAPNPVSLTHITGEFYDLNDFTRLFGEKIEQYCNFDGTQEQLDSMHKRYLKKLYRHDGKPHQFTTPDGTQFEATIVDVAPDGTLTLRHTSDNSCHGYSFKEVGFVINRVSFI